MTATPATEEVAAAVGEDESSSSPASPQVEQLPSVIHQLFGSEVETLIECRCGWSTTTKRTELLFSLFYQPNTGDVYVHVYTGNRGYKDSCAWRNFYPVKIFHVYGIYLQSLALFEL